MYSLPFCAMAVSLLLTAAPSYPVPASVPYIIWLALPAVPTHDWMAAALSIESPDGPGGAGQSWKKALLMVTARPLESLATFCPCSSLLVTRTKEASFAAELHHWLNSDEKKEKSKSTVCT